MTINLFPFLLLAIISFLSLPQIGIHLYLNQANEDTYFRYQEWKASFHMHFEQRQDIFRFGIFAKNLQTINSHNSIISRTFDLGVNQFTHLTEEQFTEFFLNQATANKNSLEVDLASPKNDFSLLKSFKLEDIDWQNLGKVSEVKNQGNCNAGYAFSTTSLVETSLMMQNQNILLSQQQIVDCSQNYGTQGCQGGTLEGALKFVQQNGLVTSKQYPYTGTKGACKYSKGSYLPDYTLIKAIGCDLIRQSLYKSPVTVAVNAKNWQLYSNGIFNNCPTTGQVNHEALLVGVTQSYWRLKNSWGSRWGQNGYIRVKLGDNCGICQKPGYAFLL